LPIASREEKSTFFLIYCSCNIGLTIIVIIIGEKAVNQTGSLKALLETSSYREPHFFFFLA
jgi:hypothetical protein